MIDESFKIVFNEKVTHDTFLMGLRSPEIAIQVRPGQFVMIRVLPGCDPLLRRPFSICGVQEDDVLLILYRVAGRGTGIMSGKRKGEKISVLGPLGHGFELPEKGRTSILVAGGMGVAPLLFLSRSIKAEDLEFMIGFKSAGEIKIINALNDRGKEVSIATDDGTSGHAGPVTELFELYLNQHRDKAVFSVFSCGPISMLQKVKNLALDQGIPCQISLETSMACGIGACQGCAVRSGQGEGPSFYHVCKDGPVFPASSIDWSSL